MNRVFPHSHSRLGMNTEHDISASESQHVRQDMVMHALAGIRAFIPTVMYKRMRREMTNWTPRMFRWVRHIRSLSDDEENGMEIIFSLPPLFHTQFNRLVVHFPAHYPFKRTEHFIETGYNPNAHAVAQTLWRTPLTANLVRYITTNYLFVWRRTSLKRFAHDLVVAKYQQLKIAHFDHSPKDASQMTPARPIHPFDPIEEYEARFSSASWSPARRQAKEVHDLFAFLTSVHVRCDQLQ
jgi:hypothetical protein